MDSQHWPTDERQRTTQRKGGPDLQDSDFWSWPHLDHGSLGRATLTSKADGRLQWSIVADTTHRRTIAPIGPSTRTFPETRPPEINVCEHSVRKRSEGGLQYLRTYFPDTDFPGDLVQDELTAAPAGVDPSDPLMGNLLELLPFRHSNDGYDVLFPMGSLGRELNVSSLSPSPSGGFIFRASGIPSFIFETPILHLSGSTPSSKSVPLPYTIALARTYTSISLIKLSSSEDTSLQVTRDIELTRSDTGDIPIVDSRILGAGPDIISVNRLGHVYKSNVYTAGKATQAIEGSRTATEDSQVNPADNFWQLGATSNRDGCFLTSSTCVKYLDFRTSCTAQVVHFLDKPGAVVTCYEPPGQDNLSRVTTSSDIIWLDDRFPKKPILSFKHHRSYDRTLKTLTVQLGFGPLVLLTSRKNGLVTVYDVSRGTDNLVHCNSPPTCLPWDKPLYMAHTGHTAVATPCMSKMSFLRLTHQGSIYQQDIHITTGNQTQAFKEGNRVVREWDADVEKLDRQSRDLRPDPGPVGGRHFTEVNFRGVYERIFSLRDDGSGEAFRDTLAQLPGFWQQMEEPLEIMLTTFDLIAYEKSKVPANFFTGCTANGNSAFQAVARGDIPIKELASLAPWSYNILGTMHRLPYDISEDWSTFREHLKKLQLESDREGAGNSLRLQTEAQEQLVVDLALSCDVFSPRPITKPHPTEIGFGTISEENRRTGVTDEPPDVEFSFFHPIRKIGANHYVAAEKTSPALTEDDTKVSCPMGVRLLLAEWEVGSDVKNYTYRDPYTATEVDHPSGPRRKQALRIPPPTQSTVVPSQRPPTVVATGTRPQWEVTGTQVAHAAKQSYSQETTSYPKLDTFSQDPIQTNTQVLSGPYGGRLMVGKRPTKKRIGGF